MSKINKRKAAGRPAGSGNIKSGYLRDCKFGGFRCSRGFEECVTELVASGQFKSKSDVLHEAVQILSARKLPATFYFINKIQ